MEDFEEIEPLQDITPVVEHAQGDMIEPIGRFAPAETLGPEPSFRDKATDFFLDKFFPEVGKMIAHEWDMGATEIAKALFGQEDGFVLYGPSLAPIKPVEMQDASQLYSQTMNEAMDRSFPQEELER